MTLSDVYQGDDLEHMQADLSTAADLLDQWRDGESVDPYAIHYIAMLMQVLAGQFPLPED